VNRKADFFYKTNRFESIRTTNRIESIRIANWNALVSSNVVFAIIDHRLSAQLHLFPIERRAVNVVCRTTITYLLVCLLMMAMLRVLFLLAFFRGSVVYQFVRAKLVWHQGRPTWRWTIKWLHFGGCKPGRFTFRTIFVFLRYTTARLFSLKAPLNLRSLIWLLMMVWSKRGNINIAAVVTIVGLQCNTLVARCFRQLVGPVDLVFDIPGLLRCD